MTTKTKKLADLLTVPGLVRGVARLTCTEGADLPIEKQDEWQRKSKSWRCRLWYMGRHYSFDFWQGSAHTKPPTCADVLECLLSDAACSDDFADFCAEFGMDEDSRKAERTHKACLKCRREMQRLLGDDFETFLYADR